MAGTCKCGGPVKAKGLCSRCYNRAYYEANADKMRAKSVAWYRNNPEKAKANNDARDKERLRELARERYWRNPLARVADRANHKARELGISGTLTAETLQARIDYFGGRCWICGKSAADTIDHVKPFGKRGLNIPANIRPACGSCNSRRSWEGRRH